MNEHDPLELLRVLSESRRDALPPPPDVAEVLQAVARDKSARPRPRRRRWWIIGALGVSFGLAGGSVAWALTHRERATIPTTVQCYQEPRLGSSSFVTEADGSDPADLCGRGWSETFPEWGPTPPMVACRATTGIAVVFPGDATTCETLGLPALDPTLSEEAEQVLLLQNRLTAAIEPLGCITQAEAGEIAESTLLEVDIEGWSVSVAPIEAEMPCGRFDLDIPNRVIHVLPLPNFFGTSTGE